MFNRTNLSTDSPNHARESSFNQDTKKYIETLFVRFICVCFKGLFACNVFKDLCLGGVYNCMLG